MLESVVISESFKIALTEAVSYLKSKSTTFKRQKDIDLIDAYAKAANVEQVKTIWQVDKSVNLNEFYYPSKIVVSDNNDDSSILVNSLSVFPENGKIVIEGIAGQGKSILLRYLAGNGLKNHEKVPVFVELRKITKRNNLESLIINAIGDLGIDFEEKELDLVLSSNKFTLLLDAFDEIPEPSLTDVLSSLESICYRNYQQQIIITSRPCAEIQKVPYFTVYNLESLQPSDYRPMLLKFFSNDESTVDQIMKSLHENNNEISSLITTPLLLTLLAITYKTFHKIPSQLHEFYENIFHVLVNRHDSTKPGFKREYKSGLNERQLEDLFCAFCFFSMISEKTALSRDEAFETLKKASRFSRIQPNSEINFLNDCIKNTCLLLEEGFHYHYIHKSIREYHAARFISTSPIELKERFYSLAINDFYKYRVELDFLKVIDDHYYNKLYTVVIYEKIFKDLGITESNGIVNVSLDDILNQARIFKYKNQPFIYNSISLGERDVFTNAPVNRIYRSVLDLVAQEIISENYTYNPSLIREPEEGERMPLLDVIKEMGLESKFETLIQNIAMNMYDDYLNISSILNEKEALISSLDFQIS